MRKEIENLPPDVLLPASRSFSVNGKEFGEEWKLSRGREGGGNASNLEEQRGKGYFPWIRFRLPVVIPYQPFPAPQPIAVILYQNPKEVKWKKLNDCRRKISNSGVKR